MVNQNLLTVFITLTAVAVLIQTGIFVGFYLVSMKLSRQAEQALTATRNILNPLQNVTENLQTVSARVAEFGATTQGYQRNLRHLRLSFLRYSFLRDGQKVIDGF